MRKFLGDDVVGDQVGPNMRKQSVSLTPVHLWPDFEVSILLVLDPSHLAGLFEPRGLMLSTGISIATAAIAQRCCTVSIGPRNIPLEVPSQLGRIRWGL